MPGYPRWKQATRSFRRSWTTIIAALRRRRSATRTFTGRSPRTTISTTPSPGGKSARCPNSLTLQYDKVLFILEPNEVTRPLARQRVMVFDYPDGRLVIKHKGRELPYRIFDKVRQVDQAAIVENKRLGAVLAYVAERQKQIGEESGEKARRAVEARPRGFSR